MMEADVQGYYQAMSVAVNKRMLWTKQTENHQQEQTEIKDEIEVVHRHHNESSRKIPS